MPDYYEVLGIDEEASEYEITQAYRNLAKQYHPDKFPEKKDLNMLKVKTNLSQAEENRLIQLEKKVQENEEKFKKIQEAHTVLSDIEKREKYDEEKNGNQCSGTSKSSSFQEKLDEMVGKMDEISSAQYKRTMRNLRACT